MNMTLKKDQIVKINGIPVRLLDDVSVETTEANVPLIRGDDSGVSAESTPKDK